MGKRAKVSYDLLVEKLNNIVIPELNVIDVSHMFNISTEANVSALMFKRENGQHLIWLHGFDDSGSDNDLEIIPILGFGPQYSSYQAARQTIDGIAFEDFAIAIDKELDLDSGKITIPMGLKSFDIRYYLHDGSNTMPSYYIADGIMYPFELDNTPILNFCTNSNSIIINGNSVVKNTIKEIVFGSSFLTNNVIGQFFLSSCTSLVSVDLRGFSNVVHISAYFLYNCTSLISIDLNSLSNTQFIGGSFLRSCISLMSIESNPLSNVTSIGGGFLMGCTSLSSINLNQLSNVTSIADNFLCNCTSLTSIQIGDVDWSMKNVNTISLMANVPNVATSVIDADTQELANIFKAKMGGALDNWTVVLNS